MSAARRAVARWGWRLFRRDWRQQLLTIGLLSVVVGAAVTGSAIAVNTQFDDDSYFGDGDTVIRIDGADPTTADAGVRAAAERFGTVDPIAHTRLAVPGSSAVVDLRRQRPDGPLGGPMLRLVDGRYPTAADEVAVTDRAATLFRVGIGDTLGIRSASFTVVGLVENPSALDDEFVLGVPDPAASSDFVNVLTVSPDDRAATTERVPGQLDVNRRSQRPDAGVAVLVVFAISILLALVGLVAAAAFVVLAQRRQRQLGMLAALGGSPRHLRTVMVANGAAVGIIAATIGTVAGCIGWLAARPATEQAADRRLGLLALPWTLVAITAVLAVGTATVAAWWPARQVSRLPITAALSGRPAAPRPVHRSVSAAAALLAGGVGLVIAGDPNSEHAKPVLLSAGLLLVVVGVVAIAPAAVSTLGVFARHLPFAPRLALRDLSRYQARAAASVSAITIGLGICVAIVAVAAANVDAASEGNLSSSQLLVEVGDVRTAAATAAERGAIDAQLDANADAVLAAAGAPPAVALDLAFNPNDDAALGEPISVGHRIDDHTFRHLGRAYVATPATLAYFGIDPSTIGDDTDLLIAEDRAVELLDTTARPDPDDQTVSQVSDRLPAHAAAPFALVTESAMQRHGWVAARGAWFVESAEPITAAQVDAATTAAATVGLQVTARDTQDALAALEVWTTLAGAVLCLAVVAMTVGLIRGESAADMRTLTATGAAPGTRRALTATTASALALLGALLGIAGAYTVLIASYRTTLDVLAPIPLAPLLTLAVGLPVVASAAGWLLAGREPSALSRRALD
jgi:putative ABC transport system permease protein